MKNIKYFTLAISSIFLIAISSSSYASDYKVFAPSECQPIDHDVPNVKYDSGGIYNGNTFPLRVACPIVRDSVFSNGIYVRAAGTVALECYVENTTTTGAIGLSVPVPAFAGAYGPWTWSGTIGSHLPYTLRCTIPSNEGLTAYEIYEGSMTDSGN